MRPYHGECECARVFGAGVLNIFHFPCSVVGATTHCLSTAVFGLVTGSGCLIAYNMVLPKRALVKMTAHGGDATTLDWHPQRKGVIATGGAMDRYVKIWDFAAESRQG